jgi:hypothetical protein
LIMGEMTGGILLACVPTFGPLLFPRRPNRSLDRHKNGGISIETIGSKPIKRMKALVDPLADSLFASETDTEYRGEELEDVVLSGAVRDNEQRRLSHVRESRQ